MELWFSEYQTKNVKLSFRIKDVLYTKKSNYQQISVFETEDFGNVLALDDLVMLTTKDEFVYHEMIAHVPLLTHGNVSKVLVIGGGDGGTVREVLKHPVKQVDLVEIDKEVVETSKKYFPTVSCGLSDPRVNILYKDGIEYVKNNGGYDVIIVDSTDPIGPAEGLFANEFYKNVFNALNKDGIMVAQMETPMYYGDLIKRTYRDMSSLFTYTNLYWAVIPTYPGAFWTFIMGSKAINPTSNKIKPLPKLKTKYYNTKLHNSYFILPPFVEELISK